MLRGNSTVNDPIIADNFTGVFGIIGGILIDSHLCRIAAFTLRQAPHEALYILPWMGVKQIEPEQVFAWSPKMIVKADELFDIRRLLKQGTIQQGTHFRSADGEFLGTMADFFFEQHSGAIIRYEVIDGPFIDPETGHGFIPAMANTQVKIETNTAYLPLSYQELAHLVKNAS